MDENIREKLKTAFKMAASLPEEEQEEIADAIIERVALKDFSFTQEEIDEFHRRNAEPISLGISAEELFAHLDKKYKLSR